MVGIETGEAGYPIGGGSCCAGAQPRAEDWDTGPSSFTLMLRSSRTIVVSEGAWMTPAAEICGNVVVRCAVAGVIEYCTEVEEGPTSTGSGHLELSGTHVWNTT